MPSPDDVLERVLRREGWTVSQGPVDDSLVAEADGDRFLLTWRADTDEAHETGAEVLTARADARPADETDAAQPSPETEAGPPPDGDAELLDATPEAEPATSEPGEPAPTGAPGETAAADGGQPDPGEVPVVRLRVDRAEAQDEARPKIVDIQETTLELVPHRAFEYTCRVPDGTGDVETYRGHILLNALTESAVTLEAPRFADGVPEGARLLEPELDAGEAEPEARDHLSDRYTRDVKVETGDGNVSVMETRRVSPEDDGVDLDPQGTWYVPVWRMEGENGSLRIDANRGEVIDESLQQETGTDAEWIV